MTRSVPASPEAPRVPARRKRGRHKVVVGCPPEEFRPADPGDVPATLVAMRPLAVACTLAQAIDLARSFNNAMLAERLATTPCPCEWAVILFRANCSKGGAR